MQSQSIASITLSDTVSHSAMVNARQKTVKITGRVGDKTECQVAIRVTTTSGLTSVKHIAAKNGLFECRYPADFLGAPALSPCVLFIDAAIGQDFNVAQPGHEQAEATVIVYGKQAPDLPSAFTCGLIDRAGHKDQKSVQWNAVRTLVNLYLSSSGAKSASAGRPGFDLANKTDFDWFKNNLTVYDFDNRDRDWSKPLLHRPTRTFWKSVWNTWFNSSNDNPVDGNPKNNSPGNFVPYTFSNDFADMLIMTVMRRQSPKALDDNLAQICREGAENLMAMQHRVASNFALKDAAGKQENYTAGAFRYGMFKNGEYMSEGNGWFYNPAFRDYEAGGVLNGRAVWALGETLMADPHGVIAPTLRESIAMALRFCLHDGMLGGYIKRTPQGHIYWRDAGEHAYLLLGMLAACKAEPGMQVRLTEDGKPVSLRSLCIDSLNALTDLEKPEHGWSIYPNVDSMAIAALAEGASLLKKEPAAVRWRTTAINVADAWMAAKVDPKERSIPSVHFGLRTGPDRMTYVWQSNGKPQFFYYQTGHWIHALANLYKLTGELRYRARAEAMVSYLCGDNPFSARLFNELGAVYNWTDDTDGDGIEDLLKQDMYPESTAFCQIGILHLIDGIIRRENQ